MRFYTLLLVLTTVFFRSYAQQNIVTAGGDVSGTGGQVSYSVGQPAYHMAESAGGKVTEGLQQPYEILFMTGLDDPSVSAYCKVFPNPAVSELRLRIERESLNGLTCQLSDNNGTRLQELKIEQSETIIPVNDLPAGVYLLTLKEINQPLTTWKVIKK